MAEAIALSGASIGAPEFRAVLRVLRSGRLALGPFARRFEQLVAGYVGVRHAVAVSSGTAGLHLLVRTLGLGPGDEVITTPFSFVASANCLLYEGVKPVFGDVDPDTLCLDPAVVERLVTPRSRAVLAVDVFGHPADWPGIARVARRHGLRLIEDSCEALGAGLARPDGPVRRCGAFGDAVVFAFYPNKQLTTGEGGIVVTDSARIADLCRSMANQGRRSGRGAWLEHVRLGYNYRLDELSAALGCAQMARAGRLLRRRQAVADAYSRRLAAIPGIRLPGPAPDAVVSWFVYVVRLAPELGRRQRDRVLAGLRARGIECSDYFRPIHLQPYYRRRFGFRRGDFPVAEAAGDRTIALPFHARLRARDIEAVAAALGEALRRL
ncbi:DegT/DnrJ/EryC1/StrS family aminotransferase [candidate division WOR-3 bacterium]|nr:DegT/DnrJ/EryC1/StrS family aminotransferase [candidate division WOR-3 bacterium]